MKTMEEIRGMNIKEITKEIKSLERDVFEVKIKIHTGQEKNISKQRKLRRQMARYKTVLNEKSSGESSTLKK